MQLLNNNDYKNWLKDLKSKIQQSQIKAALAVNSQLILLYWELGRQIVEKQEHAKWGSGFIDQLSTDLKSEFPALGGFSVSNLYSIVKFYKFFSLNAKIIDQIEGEFGKQTLQVVKDSNLQQPVGQLQNVKLQQAVGEIEMAGTLQLCLQVPWGHIVLLLQKYTTLTIIHFYIKETIENNWSRAVFGNANRKQPVWKAGKSYQQF